MLSVEEAHAVAIVTAEVSVASPLCAIPCTDEFYTMTSTLSLVMCQVMMPCSSPTPTSCTERLRKWAVDFLFLHLCLIWQRRSSRKSPLLYGSCRTRMPASARWRTLPVFATVKQRLAKWTSSFAPLCASLTRPSVSPLRK